MRTIPAFLLIFFCLTLFPSCAYLKEQVKDGVTQGVGDELAKRIPEDRREEFAAVWAADPAAGAKLAAEIIGVDKLADALEAADAANAELAAELRARGAEGLKDLWIQVALAIAGAAGTLFGLKKSSTAGRILGAVIRGVQGYIDTSGNGAALKAAIKTEANAAGIRPKLDQQVAKAKA